MASIKKEEENPDILYDIDERVDWHVGLTQKCIACTKSSSSSMDSIKKEEENPDILYDIDKRVDWHVGLTQKCIACTKSCSKNELRY
jgi:hypothetical protein